MSSSHAFLKYLRLIHLYTGVFIAPALLFFAFTGALQTFSLHETTRGSSYKPPAWAVMLAQIHKKQTSTIPVKKLPPADKQADKATQEKAQTSPTPPTETPKPSGEATPKNPLPLKCFFLLVSIGLFVSTLSGLYMSYKYIRNRRLITLMLLGGIIVPVLLTVL
ncbi:MAG TPA: PepSY domain-containing protein [Edaphobacter sp.]|jgi:hypothetical protein